MKCLFAIATALFALASQARADAFEGKVDAGAVVGASAKIKGVDGDFRYRGGQASATILMPYMDNRWVGLLVGQEYLANTNDDDGANETMATRDVMAVGAVVSPQFPIELFAGIGFSTSSIKQTKPTEHDQTYSGYAIRFGFQNGFLGTTHANVFLKFEVTIREMLQGKDAVAPDDKLLPYSMWSVPISIGIGGRI